MKLTKKEKNRISKLLSAVFILLASYFIINYVVPAYSGNDQKEYKIPEGELTVEYIDVGQADCILISSNGHNALIDAGNEEDGPKLIEYFRKLGITDFDFVMGTHPHEDHIGGLDDIINTFNIHSVYLPNATTTTKTFERLLDAIENKKLKINVPKENEEIQLGEATFKMIYSGTDTSDLNATSIITKMTYGKYSFLFTGDATSSVEKEILDKDIDVDILKVAHHGSEYSTTANFLKAATPEYAIISVGKDNKYNHPSEKTINRIQKYTSKIYKTSELGTIIVSINKEDLKISNIKTDTNGG